MGSGLGRSGVGMGRPRGELCCLERQLHAVASSPDRLGMAYRTRERLLVTVWILASFD